MKVFKPWGQNRPKREISLNLGYLRNFYINFTIYYAFSSSRNRGLDNPGFAVGTSFYYSYPYRLYPYIYIYLYTHVT